MPLLKIDGATAFNSLRGAARYPTPGRDAERYVPVPQIAHVAKFRINRDDRIFTIGSCFARNIEHALISLGLNVESSFTSGTGAGINAGAVSLKYTSKSILRDLLIFDDPKAQHQSIYSDGNGYVNLSLGGSGAQKPLTKAQALELTRTYYSNFAKIRSANVLIMTLGLVEVWYDRENDLYLNIAPRKNVIKSEPGRFELHVLSYQDIVQDLEAILMRIKEICRPDIKILITVSPVPLHATFRDMDVLQANMYSKCVQRAAVEEFCSMNPEIAYFPSFETVMLSAPKIAWVDDDYRHVRPELVRQIMSSVLRHYTDLVEAPSADALKQHFSLKQYNHICNEIESHAANAGTTIDRLPPYMRYYFGCALDELGDHDRALSILSSVVKVWKNHPNATQRHQKLAGMR